MTGRAAREADRAKAEALALFEAGDHAAAAAALASLVAAGARRAADPVLRRAAGMALARSGAPGQGAAHLAEARRLAPDDPLAALWHGIVLQAAGCGAAAAEALEAAARLAPDDPAPLVHLARARLAAGRAADAAAAGREALRRAPGLPEARHAVAVAELEEARRSEAPAAARAACWEALGEACLALDNVADARQCLEEAHALAPSPAIARTRARLAHLAGAPLAALDEMRGAIAAVPDDDAARLLLARFLVLDGAPREALAVLDDAGHACRATPEWALERCRALGRAGEDAEAAAAVAALARRPDLPAALVPPLLLQAALGARRAGDAAAAADLLGRAAGAAAGRTASIEDRIEAHFTIAACCEADRADAAAFAHLRAGHALLARAQPFSRETTASLFGAAAEAARDVPATGAPPEGATGPMPVFVVGLPRTGTSLLQQILASHGMVAGLGERLAVREALVAATGTTDAVAAARGTAAIPPDRLAALRADFRAELRRRAPTASVAVDKMPDNLVHLPFVARLLPEARVIVCTRDLRDVGTSIFRQRFLGAHPYAHDPADLGWYIARHETLRARLCARLPLPILVLDHAEWIADFEGTLRRVLAFLDLPWDPACVRFFERDLGVRTASRDQVRRGINADGVGRWRRYEKELGQMLRELPPVART